MTIEITYQAPRVLPFHGFITNDGRRGGFCWDEKPRCVAARAHEPEGHRFVPRSDDVRGGVPITDAITRCHHRESPRGKPCDALLYMAVLTFGGSERVAGAGQRFIVMVEVTKSMVEEMRKREMLFLERMLCVGLAVPGLALDLCRD